MWESREPGLYEALLLPPRCKYHGKPYIDVVPDETPCVGIYEQAELEAMQDDGR